MSAPGVRAKTAHAYAYGTVRVCTWGWKGGARACGGVGDARACVHRPPPAAARSPRLPPCVFAVATVRVDVLDPFFVVFRSQTRFTSRLVDRLLRNLRDRVRARGVVGWEVQAAPARERARFRGESECAGFVNVIRVGFRSQTRLPEWFARRSRRIWCDRS